MKICKMCEKELSEDMFHKWSKSGDKLRPLCKTCMKERDETYDFDLDGKKLRTSLHRKNNIEKYNDASKRYYYNNLERKRSEARARKKKRVEENRQHVNAIQSKHLKNHPEIDQLAKQRRRARKAAVVCDLTRQEWLLIKNAYDNCCAYCGKVMERLTQDHIIPLSKLGPHSAKNIVPACRSCNSKKGNRGPLIPLEELILRHPFYQNQEGQI